MFKFMKRFKREQWLTPGYLMDCIDATRKQHTQDRTAQTDAWHSLTNHVNESRDRITDLEDILKKYGEDTADRLAEMENRILQAGCSHEEWGWFIRPVKESYFLKPGAENYLRRCESCGKEVYVNKREFHEGCRYKAVQELDKLDKGEKEE